MFIFLGQTYGFQPIVCSDPSALKKTQGFGRTKSQKRELQLGWILPLARIEFRTLEHTNGVLSILNLNPSNSESWFFIKLDLIFA